MAHALFIPLMAVLAEHKLDTFSAGPESCTIHIDTVLQIYCNFIHTPGEKKKKPKMA